MERLCLAPFGYEIQEGELIPAENFREVEEIFEVEVQKVRTLNKKNKKYSYVQLKSKYPAIDIATKLGLM